MILRHLGLEFHDLLLEHFIFLAKRLVFRFDVVGTLTLIILWRLYVQRQKDNNNNDV